MKQHGGHIQRVPGGAGVAMMEKGTTKVTPKGAGMAVMIGGTSSRPRRDSGWGRDLLTCWWLHLQLCQ